VKNVDLKHSLKYNDTYFDIDDIVLIKTGDKYSAGLGGSVTIDVPKHTYQGRISSIKTGVIQIDSSHELNSIVNNIRIDCILDMNLISKAK
jgi:hypothetical protein